MLMPIGKRNAGSGSGSGAGAPVPPQRHSSIRPNAPLTPPTHMANASHQFGSNSGLSAGGGTGTGSGAGGAAAAAGATVGRLVIDLETKFGKRFHNVTEFPKPPPFLNIQKIYPSRTFKASNAAQTPSNNNISINNNITAVCNNNASTNAAAPGGVTLPPALKPAYAPLKKHRAPAPPPQAGVAAAAVSVIRQSSFLYGGGAAGTAGSGSPVRPQSQAAGSVARNSTVC